MKECFIKELVLAAPDLDKKLRIEVNASDYAIGGVCQAQFIPGWKSAEWTWR